MVKINKILFFLFFALVLTLSGCLTSCESNPPSGVPSGAPTASLRIYFPLDETSGTSLANDGTGTYNKAFTFNSGYASFKSGADCQDGLTCVAFDKGQGADLNGDPVRFMPDGYNYSIYMWMKPYSTGVVDNDIYFGQGDGLTIESDGTNIIAQVRPDSGFPWTNANYGSMASLDSTWNLYSATWNVNTGNLTTYLNCVQIDTGSGNGYYNTPTQFAGLNARTKTSNVANGTYQHYAVYETIHDTSTCNDYFLATGGSSGCTESITNTSWSAYTNTTCVEGGLGTEYDYSRFLTEYDSNFCGTFTNITFWDNGTTYGCSIEEEPISTGGLVLDLGFDTPATCGVDSTSIHSDFTLQGTANCIEDVEICKWYGCLDLTTNGGDYLSGVSNFLLTDDLSVSFWVKPTQSPTIESQAFYEIGTGGTSNYIYAEESDYGLNPRWKAQHGEMTDNAGSSHTSSSGTWAHYIVTYNGSDFVTYKNGARVHGQEYSYGNLNYSMGGALNVGKAIYGIDVIGYLDEFKIYNSSLSASEAYAVYDEQRMGTPPAKDLYVANVTYLIPRHWTDDGGHNEPLLNTVVPVNITIKNQGTESVGSFNYQYVWDNGTILKQGTSSLGIGASIRIDTSFTLSDYSWRKFYVKLDYDNAIVEDEEVNNNYTINIPYMDSYWTLGHNSTTIQEAITYCLTSGDLADTRCDWYRGFVSDDFTFSSGNSVDPRGKKYLENAIGCLINDYNPTKSQCIRAFKHLKGWGALDPDTYTDVQAIHELLWVLQANDIMMTNISKAKFQGNMTNYYNICQAVSTLSNTRPDLSPGVDLDVISGANGWGFGSGIGSICDLTVGNVIPNSNNDLIVQDNYWYFNVNDYWHNRIQAYLRARGNATDSNNQERMLYKWYGENKIAPIVNYLTFSGNPDFNQYNNAYCSMAKETIYSMLDYRYNGATVFGDENRVWRMISAGDTNSYESVGSDTENKWDIITYYGLMCDDQDVKDAIMYLRNFGDVSTTETDANGGIPAVYNFYKLKAETSDLSNLKSFQKYFYDTQNEIATFRPSYTYYNDTVLQFDGGQHKFSGHPNAQGRYHYYEGYEFLAYNQVPYNDNTRTESWANTISYSNDTTTNGYASSCAGAILYQHYGDNQCNVIGNYPFFAYMTKAQTGSVENEWGSDDGLYGGLLNIIPMGSITTPINEYVIVANANVYRFVKAVGAPSLILDGVLNRDTEIKISKLRSDSVAFKAFDSNTYLNFSVDYSNVTGKMYAINSTIKYGFTKTATPTGKGYYRRSYYQMNVKSAEWITSEIGYESVVPTKSTLTSGDDRGVLVNGQSIIFDTDGDGVTFSTYVTDGWGLVVINGTHIAVFNTTSITNDGTPISLPSTPYSGILASTPGSCTPSIVNSSWSTPVLTECVGGFQDSSSYLTQYDANYCGTVDDVIFWNNFTQSCGSETGAPDFNDTFVNGHSSLRFNIASAVGNYTPLWGNPTVKICNNGTGIMTRLVIGVDTVVPSDLRVFASTGSSIAGSSVLSTSETTIATDISVDSCTNISFWLEARDSTPSTYSFNVGYGVY